MFSWIRHWRTSGPCRGPSPKRRTRASKPNPDFQRFSLSRKSLQPRHSRAKPALSLPKGGNPPRSLAWTPAYAGVTRWFSCPRVGRRPIDTHRLSQQPISEPGSGSPPAVLGPDALSLSAPCERVKVATEGATLEFQVPGVAERNDRRRQEKFAHLRRRCEKIELSCWAHSLRSG